MENLNGEKIDPLGETENFQTNLTADIKEQVKNNINSKESMENDIKKLHEIIDNRIKELSLLKNGIDTEGLEREILDDLLDLLKLEKNQKSRFAAFKRIAELRDDNLRNLLGELNFSEEEKIKAIAIAYDFTTNYHNELHSELIEKIETGKLLSPFYRELIKNTHKVGIAFDNFTVSWQRELIDGVNKRLEERFGNDTDKIMSYLKENDLFDLGHDSEEADRSYSVLKEKGDSYEKLSYAEYFPEEIGEIIKTLDEFILNLSKHEDSIYNQKEAYINYLKAIKEAFLEKNTDSLVEKWSQVDASWMKVNGPFQITHPMEYYEDKYRKAVAPHWDLRLKNDFLFESKVKSNISLIFEKIFIEKGKDKYESVYNFSKYSTENVGLYISSPLIYSGAWMTGLVSAQVIPNDAIVSKECGKKIFSFTNEDLKKVRNSPVNKFVTNIFEKSLFEKYRNFILGNEIELYKTYDVETIGHEFGHNLWMDIDTESKMNQNGNFKNIEEWKATTGGLVSFFNNPDESILENLLIDHISRVIKLVRWMEIEDSIPYYCESLIHLKILFDSGVIFVNDEKKVELNLNDENLENLKELYFEAYSDLVDTYLEKKNADEFLYKYTVKENGVFLPKDKYLRNFTKYSYELYKKLGNEIDENY